MKVGYSVEPGQKIGFVVAKEGLLLRVVGLFIVSERAFVILAIDERLLSSEERPLETLIVDKVKFHFVKTPKPDVTTDFTGRREASMFVDVPSPRELVKSYYQNPEEGLGAPTIDPMERFIGARSVERGGREAAEEAGGCAEEPKPHAGYCPEGGRKGEATVEGKPVLREGEDGQLGRSRRRRRGVRGGRRHRR